MTIERFRHSPRAADPSKSVNISHAPGGGGCSNLGPLNPRDDRIDAYRRRILLTNARHGALPFLFATLGFVGLILHYDNRTSTVIWVLALGVLAAVRATWALANPIEDGNDLRSATRWVHGNTVLLGLLGALYGLMPLQLGLHGDVIWLLAIVNLWLAGLTFAILVSQAIVWSAGLAFAIPAMAPLLVILLISGEFNLTVLGLGNILLCAYFYAMIRQTRGAILEEARHRLMFEQLAEHYNGQRQRSEELVADLTEEIERRKDAEVALREARDIAEAMSNQDPLTSLANRRVFERVLAREWMRTLRQPKPISLVLCDIDWLRSYNEHYGNCAGDQCLQLISTAIAGAAKRAGDLVARYDTERFAILLTDTTEARALDVAESLRQAIYDLTILHRGAQIERVVTASFGVATLVPSAANVQGELVETADRALQRAKRGGGNSVFAVYGYLAND